MELSDNKVFYKKLIYSAAVVTLIIAFFITMYRATIINPDSDSFWLIESGRYIVENHSVPKTNPWVAGGELGIIVQQPICAIANYLWFSISEKLCSMWQLATIMNFFMILAMLYLTKKWKYNPAAAAIGIAFAEICVAMTELNNTRPFQFTIAMSCVLIANLETARRTKSYKRAVITIALLSIWQANYQMASLIAIPLFISCYTVGGLCENIFMHIKEKDRKLISLSDLVKGILLYVVWAVFSVLNPYGIDGALYLYKSREAMKMCKDVIKELRHYDIFSMQVLVIVLVFLLFLLLYRKNIFEHFTEMFLVGGSVLAALLAIRNMWMVIVASLMVVPPSIQVLIKHLEASLEKKEAENAKRMEADEQPKKKKSISVTNLTVTEKKRILLYVRGTAFAAAIICIVLAINSQALFESPMENLVKAIQKIPEDASIYTTFNTGGMVEFSGRKAYIDARPELFYPTISGGEDRLSEWFTVQYGASMVAYNYMENKHFDYYVIKPSDRVFDYFVYTQSGEFLYTDYMNGYYIIRKANNEKETEE